MDILNWFQRFFHVFEEADQGVIGIAQCRQCKVNIKFNKKSRTNCKDHAKTHKAEWKYFEEEKATKESMSDNQRQLHSRGGTLPITSGLLPRTHENNIKLRNILSYSKGKSVAPINIVQSPIVITLVTILHPVYLYPRTRLLKRYKHVS